MNLNLSWKTAPENKVIAYYICQDRPWMITSKRNDSSITYILERHSIKWVDSKPISCGFSLHSQRTFLLKKCLEDRRPPDPRVWGLEKIQDYYSSMKMGFLS